MALSMLHLLYGPDCLELPRLQTVDPSAKKIVAQMLQNRFNAPLTSSCGRLFDAMAALLDLNMVSSFEGQAAMQLETLARKSLTSRWKDILVDQSSGADRYLTQENNRRWEINSAKFVKKTLDDISAGMDRPAIALQFHSWLISCISRLVEKLSSHTGIDDVVLSGGCLQNGIVLEGLIYSLTKQGLRPYTGLSIPVNDGGVSVGQALIGGLHHVSRSAHES
jgi:hydrogenase maturation protein HypF